MDLRSLVDIFGQNLTVKTISGGGYVDGIWQDPTETETTKFGVLLHLSYEDVQKLTGGEYTTQDKKLIVKDDVSIKINDILVDDGNEYEVEKELDQSFHGKIKSYVCPKVVE